jgi:hypothetical protein
MLSFHTQALRPGRDLRLRPSTGDSSGGRARPLRHDSIFLDVAASCMPDRWASGRVRSEDAAGAMVRNMA